MRKRTIYTVDDLYAAVEHYGMLAFWDENLTSSWTLCGVDFNTLWSIREELVNSRRVAYGKFMRKKSTFVSLSLFPHLAALRRDGYDFDSLLDEGRVPNREAVIMNSVLAAKTPVPSYMLGKSLGVKGYDSCVTSLQNKTYLCVTFKKSAMGTALIAPPEDIFGYDKVRSCYSLPTAENIKALKDLPGLADFDKKEVDKILSPAI